MVRFLSLAKAISYHLKKISVIKNWIIYWHMSKSLGSITANKFISQEIHFRFTYPIIFTHDLFETSNPTLAELIKTSGDRASKALFVIDSNVLKTAPDLPNKIKTYIYHHNGLLEIVYSPYIMPGGEECKNDFSEVSEIHKLINSHGLCRHSFVFAIGGGAVLDTTGYAAATAHRGIRLIRIPTTVLAQNDAGIGVKNGINLFGRKNFIGTFNCPFAVINDFDFLKTLTPRELKGGISEAIKVALIKDSSFFNYLESKKYYLTHLDHDTLEEMIIKCARLHLDHIGNCGDPFETGSSRPLDFGHWSAHKLEEITSGELSHGEAVAIGIALDSMYSTEIGLLPENDLTKIISLLEEIGFDLYHEILKVMDIEKAIKDFQEHLGGKITIPLIRRIGEKIELNGIDPAMYKRCINNLAGKRKGVLI